MIRVLLIITLIFFSDSLSLRNSENKYYIKYINESEWNEGLGVKVNSGIDSRSFEITSICYYLGLCY